MKRIFACFAVLILLCCSCAYNGSKNDNSASSFTPSKVNFTPIEARIIVNKKDISDTATAFAYSEYYAVIPLIAVSKALGAEVKWESKTKAVITANGENYVLDTSKKELTKAEDGVNILTGIPGGPSNVYGYERHVGEEYYIDHWRALSFLNDFGVYCVDVDLLFAPSVFVNKDEPEPDIYGEFSVDDFAEKIQLHSSNLETSKDAMPDEERSVYLKSYGDLNDGLSVKYAALDAFERLYDMDFYTLTEVKVYRDQASSCWMAKIKSAEELSLYKNRALRLDYGTMAIFTDDGKLLLVKEKSSS